MFAILMIFSIFALTNSLSPKTEIELGDDKIKQVLSKYISNVPDIDEQFVIDERLSRAISHYFKGKISSFPLYKVSVKIDRTPVKIPWTLGNPNIIKMPPVPKKKPNDVKKGYRFEKANKKKADKARKPIKKVRTAVTPITTKSSTINTTL